MRSLRVVIGLATAVLCVPFATQTILSTPAQRQAVRIRVIDVDSRLPIAHARLTSTSTAPLPPTITDEHGDVSIEVPSAGRSVRVTKAGYAPGSVRLDGTGDIIDVALARAATISGRVVDAAGLPVVGRSVRVTEKIDRDPGTYQARTNDLGEYRVGALPEGTYAVTLLNTAPAASAVSPTASDSVEHIVMVRRGDDVGGIDFVAGRVTCVVRVAPEQSSLERMVYGTGRIIGRVVTSAGIPVGCVEVTAFRGTERAATTATDTDGRYVLGPLRAGAYPIEFKRDGYVTVQWGQQQQGTPGRPVQLRAREDLKNVDATLRRGGAISGTVLDEFLEPAENVIVRALELRGDEDRPMAVGGVSAQTDDRGRYRLFGLNPGRYIVSTAAATSPADPRSGKGYAPAYYPGVTEIASARPVEVVQERDRDWVDFPREPVRVATITGSAVNSRNEPVTDRVVLVASQRSGAVIAETQGAEVKGPDGAFTIPNVPPGDYVIQATSKRADAAPEFGMQYVTVYQEDPPPVRIKTAAGLDVQGRLIEEGSPLVDPREFGVTAVPVDWDQTSVLTGVQTLTPANDGTLALSGVTGPRRFVLTASPTDWYLKSIRFRGRDVTDEVTGFPLSGLGFIRDFEVVVSNKGATIVGEAMDGTGPASDYSVLLFSSNPDHWFRNSRFVKIARSNRAGKFRIEGVADGDYLIIAVDPLDGSADAAWQRRDYLQSLTISAGHLRLREGDERNLTLAVTHR